MPGRYNPGMAAGSDQSPVQAAVQRELGLRIGPEMARYLVRSVQAAAGDGTIPIIGGDARTGVPVRKQVPLDRLRQLIAGADCDGAAAGPDAAQAPCPYTRGQ
jgi:ribosomal protein S6E (S10)